MRVAAYQAPLSPSRCSDALALIRDQVDRCEALGVEILCCPEAVMGGLADYSDRPTAFALDVESGELAKVLAPLASPTVTTILGFTEIDRCGCLYNAAAIWHRGAVVGVYRKVHPAINRSVYKRGYEVPVFTVGALTFGILICRDSTDSELAWMMARQGATTLFLPTNNGMPPAKGGPELVSEARARDAACAIEHRVAVIRADVAGQTSELVSYGSSAIVGHDGSLLASAKELEPDLLFADIATPSRPYG